MELKKSMKADINKWRSTFFLAGLVAILLLLNLAFDWKSHPEKFTATTGGTIIFENDVVRITKPEKPRPKIQKKVITDIKLIDNDKKTDMRDEFITADNWDNDLYIDTVEEPDIDDDYPEFFPFPEKLPEFQGNLKKYLVENIKYPQMEREIGTEGTVFVALNIDAQGRVSYVTIERGVSPGLDDEAIRVIKAMPRWKPAIQGDRPVATKIRISIKFTLKNNY